MKSLFPKIGNRKKLSQIIEAKIEELIRSKKLIAGQKLPTEIELCKMFGVSRTSLREALHMLSAKGLITVKKGSGIYINDYSSETAKDFISLYLDMNFDKDYIMYVIKIRQMLEPNIVRLAASNRTDEQLLKLEKILTDFKNCNHSNVKKLGELDRRFHLTIAEASANPLIPMIIDPVFQLMPKIRTMVYATINHAESAAKDYHQKIFNCIVQKDVEGAYVNMTEHLRIAEEHSRVVLETI